MGDDQVQAPARKTVICDHRLRRSVLALALATCGFGFLAGSAAAASFTWSGAEPLGTSNWSNGGNWGGTAPSGSVETLTFPAQTSDACAAQPPTATCYQSNNDLSGLKINALSFDDGAPYSITGNAITLGSGGISAGTSSTSFATPPRISTPIVLGAEQKWSIDGNNIDAQLELEGNVTGEAHQLAISLTHETFLGVYGEVEVGPVTVTGGGSGSDSGEIALGYHGHVAGLNAGDKNTTSFKEGAGLFAAEGTTGPLSLSGARLQVGEAPSGGGLTVAGGVTLDSSSEFQASISKPGTSAGTDYSQLSVSETVNLGEAHLQLSGVAFPEGGGFGFCPTLKVGDVDTLITTSGPLISTFASVSNGTVVPVNCSPGTPPTVRINYTEHTVTATVVTPGSGGKPTTAKLAASPENAVTDQNVALTATVSAESGTPSGTVSFENHGVSIPGCENQPLSLSSPHTATCNTSFASASSPEELTAVFAPTLGTELEGSTSAVDNLTVGKDATATAIAISSGIPAVGASVTYTATVTPAHAGAAQPSGSVEFLDGGTPIGACASQPLTASASFSTATCTLSYPAAGVHSITGTYLADSNFMGSSSAPAQTVTVQSKNEGGGPPGESHGPGATSGGGVLAFKSNVLPARETVTLASGTVMIRLSGTSTFVPLSGSSTIPDGSEIDATNGRVVITVATPSGKAVSAEVYGGRFRIHQDSGGEPASSSH